jgi:hypothetical protein
MCELHIDGHARPVPDDLDRQVRTRLRADHNASRVLRVRDRPVADADDDVAGRDACSIGRPVTLDRDDERAARTG